MLAAAENEDLATMPECFVGGQPLVIQSIVAAHTATISEWAQLLANVETSKVGSNGSAFTRCIQGPCDLDEADCGEAMIVKATKEANQISSFRAFIRVSPSVAATEMAGTALQKVALETISPLWILLLSKARRPKSGRLQRRVTACQ